MSVFGKRLKYIRESLNYNREDFAKKIGVAGVVLKNYENTVWSHLGIAVKIYDGMLHSGCFKSNVDLSKVWYWLCGKHIPDFNILDYLNISPITGEIDPVIKSISGFDFRCFGKVITLLARTEADIHTISFTMFQGMFKQGDTFSLFDGSKLITDIKVLTVPLKFNNIEGYYLKDGIEVEPGKLLDHDCSKNYIMVRNIKRPTHRTNHEFLHQQLVKIWTKNWS